MLELDIYRAMTRYNRWMNQKLLDACSKLSDEERKRDMGAPFGSIHGLWNHLLVTDRLWLARFTDQPRIYTSLSQEVCAGFEELRQERAKTDDAIDAFIADVTSERLAAPFTFTAISLPQKRTLLLYIAVSHMFNHQTHHRGQITALLEQLDGDCGVTDLAAMPEWNLE